MLSWLPTLCGFVRAFTLYASFIVEAASTLLLPNVFDIFTAVCDPATSTTGKNAPAMGTFTIPR